MKTSAISIIILLFTLSHGLSQDHGHLNVGAASTNYGAKLLWENGSIFATNSGYIKTLFLTNAGRYAGQYQQNITLTALPATAEHGGPAALHPAFGSLIYARIISVQGPAGGVFNFWESTGNTPAISVQSGDTSTNLFKLTESDGSPGSDPYGHYHGRRFTATIPGIYTVTFQAHDLSTNGTGGGPIHTSSDPISVYFQAGPNIQSISKVANTNRITFGAYVNSTFELESTDDLSNTNWNRISAFVGTDRLIEAADTNNVSTQQFYRIRVR